jgi:hypothetical protein
MADPKADGRALLKAAQRAVLLVDELARGGRGGWLEEGGGGKWVRRR